MALDEKTAEPTIINDSHKLESEFSHTSTSDNESTEEELPLREAPDGGLKAWLVVVGSFCGFFASQGYGYSWGVFFDELNANVYPGQMTELSWIGSLWYCLCNITGPFYIYMASKVDDRYILATSCILSCLAMMLASITNAVWQLYITQGIMSGFGASLAWFSCMRGPQMWFSKRRGLAVGITMAASGAGGLTFSYIAGACFETIGYEWALRILGFMQFALLAVAAATCWRLNPPKKNVPIVDIQDLKNKKFLVLFFIHFIGNFAFYIPSGFVPSYARYLDLDPFMRSNLSAIMSAVMFFGKISVGFVSDYVGRFNMAVICGLMACIAHLAVWVTATSAGSMWAFVVLYGLFGGGYIAMITAVITEVVGVDRIESGTGWAFFAWCFGGLLGQPLASAIVEGGNNGEDYRGAVIFAGCLFFVGACAAAVLRVVQGGYKLNKRV
ncbi:major facilitator superfamily domain-containing protein [Zychaea mexicana]|uniref:major facilitator superfamily domain-containing protein n=1 Tax=Zychaea mexicana TaxID=64656 RepID=UPI0022FE72D5|nr:major facilitator superfamily domain-containing protein [Zychaea mexicana]KAI9492078.1 major facilitator superfamily domain-containing protein [Zychaea mexicana]